MSAIECCRTSALGGHLEQCDACGYERNAYNSCGDRHCPKCQSLARAAGKGAPIAGDDVHHARRQSHRLEILGELELVVGDAEKARTFTKRLLEQDKVDIMVGGSTTGTTMAAVPLAEQAAKKSRGSKSELVRCSLRSSAPSLFQWMCSPHNRKKFPATAAVERMRVRRAKPPQPNRIPET
mgnify:CR=1 FL=1